jgi:L-asparaginase
MSESESKGRIALLALGGTASMVSGPDRGAHPVVDANGLLAELPADLVERVIPHSLRPVPGASLRTSDVETIAAVAREFIREGGAGVVVVQGTDSVEETSFALDLLWGEDAPVVFTGAMRHFNALSSDGSANLADAIRVAGSPASRHRGSLVVFNGLVHAARFAQKTHSSAIGAFSSNTAGPLGLISEGEVRYFWEGPSRVPPLASTQASAMPRVALITATLDDDGALMAWATENCDGVVIDAFGGGHVPEWWAESVLGAAGRIPIVLASRTGAGPVLENTYEFSGSEIGLLAGGVISAGLLSGPKARILLKAALSNNWQRGQIADHFRLFR